MIIHQNTRILWKFKILKKHTNKQTKKKKKKNEIKLSAGLVSEKTLLKKRHARKSKENKVKRKPFSEDLSVLTTIRYTLSFSIMFFFFPFSQLECIYHSLSVNHWQGIEIKAYLKKKFFLKQQQILIKFSFSSLRVTTAQKPIAMTKTISFLSTFFQWLSG